MNFLRKYRFFFLLSSLLLLLVITPAIGDNHFIGLILSFLISYILLSCILVLYQNSLFFRIGMIMAVPYFVINWFFGYYPTLLWLERIDLILGVVFFGFVTVVMLIKILKREEVDTETVFAALAAYLLLGFTWMFIYALIDSYLPGSFTNIPPDTVDPRYRFTYFSFVTLTTLGYGDITPVNAVAQSWTILEAIIGQIYLVVVISGLVGIFISQTRHIKSD